MSRKGLQGDAARRAGRVPSRRRQKGDVLFYDTFSDGGRPTFNHWRQHYTGVGTAGQPYNPPGLTRYPGLDAYALVLSTPDRPTSEIPSVQQQFSTYKNLSRYFTDAEVGLLSFSGFFTAMPGRVAPGSNWAIGIDSQEWGSADRSFFKAECRYPGGANAQWYLYDNAGDPIALPSSTRHTAGINQNKANFNYVELVVDLNQNGGRGAYHSLQVNDALFDLTDTDVWADPTESGQQAIQGSSGSIGTSSLHYADFDGGFNFGIFGGSPSADTSYPFRLVCSRLCGTIYDAD